MNMIILSGNFLREGDLIEKVILNEYQAETIECIGPEKISFKDSKKERNLKEQCSTNDHK